LTVHPTGSTIDSTLLELRTLGKKTLDIEIGVVIYELPESKHGVKLLGPGL